MYKLLIILFVLYSCASHKPNNIDTELKPVYNKFINEYTLRTGNTPPLSIELHLKDLKGELGWYDRDKDETLVDHLTWLSSSVSFRELLLYHELGHHILKRLHRDGKYKDGCPLSIMNSKLYGECYRRYSRYYIEELFSVSNEF